MLFGGGARSWVPQESPLRVCTPPASPHLLEQHPGVTHGSLLGAPICACPSGLIAGIGRGGRRKEFLSWGIPTGNRTHRNSSSNSSSSPKVHLQAKRKDLKCPGFTKTQEPKLIRSPLPEQGNHPQLEELCHNPFFIWPLFSGGLEGRTTCLSTVTGSSLATPPSCFRGSIISPGCNSTPRPTPYHPHQKPGGYI